MEITYKSAWFMAHRLREAVRTGDLAPFGGEGNIVESDETLFGREGRAPARECQHGERRLLAPEKRTSARTGFPLPGFPWFGEWLV